MRLVLYMFGAYHMTSIYLPAIVHYIYHTCIPYATTTAVLLILIIGNNININSPTTRVNMDSVKNVGKTNPPSPRL